MWGDSPLSQNGNDESELAAARRRRAREFRFAARSAGRSGTGVHPQSVLLPGLIREHAPVALDVSLSAAAMTYVAAALTGIVTLLYYLLRSGLLGGDD